MARRLLARFGAGVMRHATFDVLLAVVDDVFPVTLPIVERAKAIVLERRGISARDALHVAAMERHGVDRILTFDAGFDGVPGVERLEI